MLNKKRGRGLLGVAAATIAPLPSFALTHPHSHSPAPDGPLLMACSRSPALIGLLPFAHSRSCLPTLVCIRPFVFECPCLRLPVCVCTHLLSLAPVHCSYPLGLAPHLCAPGAVAILALTGLPLPITGPCPISLFCSLPCICTGPR